MSARPLLEMKSGREAVWAMNARTCLYHATVDGRRSLCGMSEGLVPSRMTALDGFAELMACPRCQEKVRYLRKERP